MYKISNQNHLICIEFVQITLYMNLDIDRMVFIRPPSTLRNITCGTVGYSGMVANVGLQFHTKPSRTPSLDIFVIW